MVARPLDAYQVAYWTFVGFGALAGSAVGLIMLVGGNPSFLALGILSIAVGLWIELFSRIRGYHSRLTRVLSQSAILVGALLVLWDRVTTYFSE
jgi:hypothetical protein